MGVEGLMDWKGNPINKEKHGGHKAASFIYLMAMVTNMAFMPNLMHMVGYLGTTMHMDVTTSSTAVTTFMGATSFFALFGGFLSDSYITRFTTILIFAPLEFLGFSLLAMQAHFTSLHPPNCDPSAKTGSCKSVEGYQVLLLYMAMYTLALGEGFLRANLASLGSDQFDEDDPMESRKKSSFFNWFGFSILVGSLTGFTFIAWIASNMGWEYGFGVSAGVILLGVGLVAVGFSFYRHQKPTGSPLTRILQVFVVAFRKRKLVLSENEEELLTELVKGEMEGGEVLPHTKGLQWLDKASIFDGSPGSWSCCSVTQVEETKIVLCMFPIFFCAVFSYISIPQLMAFTVQQGSTMDTRVGAIHIPIASLLIIPLILQMALLVAYDRLFVPFARKITGHGNGVTPLQRISIGFVSTSAATFIAGLVEWKRKRVAEEHGVTDAGNHVPMSVLWLILQFIPVGITDVFSFVGLLDFFNTEVSRGMKSLGTAFFWCIIGLASLTGSLLVHIVNRATRSNGRIGWLEGNNLNMNYLDRYYWLLSVIGMVAFLNYLYWAKRYVYSHNPHLLLS